MVTSFLLCASLDNIWLQGIWHTTNMQIFDFYFFSKSDSAWCVAYMPVNVRLISDKDTRPTMKCSSFIDSHHNYYNSNLQDKNVRKHLNPNFLPTNIGSKPHHSNKCKEVFKRIICSNCNLWASINEASSILPCRFFMWVEFS